MIFVRLGGNIFQGRIRGSRGKFVESGGRQFLGYRDRVEWLWFGNGRGQRLERFCSFVQDLYYQRCGLIFLEFSSVLGVKVYFFIFIRRYSLVGQRVGLYIQSRRQGVKSYEGSKVEGFFGQGFQVSFEVLYFFVVLVFFLF